MTEPLLRIRHGCPGRRGSAAKATPPWPRLSSGPTTTARRRGAACVTLGACRHPGLPSHSSVPSTCCPMDRSSGTRPCPAAHPASSSWRCRPGRTTAPIDIVAVRDWLERVPGLRLDGERPTASQLAARLASFWLPAADGRLRRPHQQVPGRPGVVAAPHAPRRPEAASRRPLAVDPPRPGQGAHLVGRDRRRPRSTRTASRAPSPPTSRRRSRPSLAGIRTPAAVGEHDLRHRASTKRTGITGAQLAEGEAPAVAPKPTTRGTQAAPPAGRPRARHEPLSARAAT